MGKWASYTIYNNRGEPLVTFKGKKVKKMEFPEQRAQMGFQMGPAADAIATTTLDIEVQCDCGADHEEHYE